MQNKGIGSSTVVGLGGDRVTGLNFVEVLSQFATDDQTEVVVLIGEIGGKAEEDAAAYIQDTNYSKPVVAYLAGKSAPPGKRMGHAGAIIERGKGTYEGKVKALEAVGVKVATMPFDIADYVTEALANKLLA
jgi:succinyl-CoA synthetase alpha subunit